MSASFTINVTWRGQTAIISLPVADPTLDELGQRMEKELGASFETLKLLVPGRKGHIAPARQRGQAASAAGLNDGCKALLLASKAEDVTQVRASRDLPGIRGFEDELRRAARRRRTARTDANPQPPRAEHTFGGYEAWQRPGLRPAPDEALKLLYRLASDPGILGVMAEHRYRVGLLSEMPPEGKVGISPVCILGVNHNAGQEISLRLRTDDLKGFRKYERIRETLVHELAHMEYGEHDNDFKRLNSQLSRECAAINARYIGGHSLLAEEASRLGGAGLDRRAAASELDDPALLDGADRVMAATARLSGRTLRQLAAIGGATGGAAATAEAAAAATAAVAAVPLLNGAVGPAGGGDGGGSSSSDGVEEDGGDGDVVRQFEHFDAATERAEAAARRLGSMADAPQDGRDAGGRGGGGTDGDGSGGEDSSSPAASAGNISEMRDREPADAAAAELSAPPGSAPAEEALAGAALEEAAQHSVLNVVEATAGDPMYVDAAGAASEPCPSGSTAVEDMAPATATADVAASAPLAPCGGAAQSGADPSALRGPAEGGPQQSPPAPPSPPPPAPLQLSLRPPEGLVSGSDSREGAGGGGAAVTDSVLDAAQVKLRQAWSALSQMAAAVQDAPAVRAAAAVPAPTAEDVGMVLDTIETLLGNAVHFPTEDRYRRVRLGNGAFQRRVGRLPGGLELLRVAGFVEEGSGAEAVLRLRRNDPGLLWLVLSAVREAREQVAEQFAAAAGGAAGQV